MGLSKEFIQEIFMNGGSNDRAKGSVSNIIKCILLHSTEISAADEVVHCSKWIENSINETDMLTRSSLYDEKDVRCTLLSFDGGVTSEVLRNATETLKMLLTVALTSFASTRYKDEAELQHGSLDH
jgi:hypothetical protein